MCVTITVCTTHHSPAAQVNSSGLFVKKLPYQATWFAAVFGAPLPSRGPESCTAMFASPLA